MRPAERYCVCGTRLARDNSTHRCAACRSADRNRPLAAPNVPAAFWRDEELQEALSARHMGRVIRAYRNHAHHGRRPLPQDVVAGWLGLTQAQLSRIENGSPMLHLDRLIEWAVALGVPPEYLWFKLPDELARNAAVRRADRPRDFRADDQEREEAVKRSRFLRLGGTLVGAGLLATATATPELLGRTLTPRQVAQWLAWELWRRQATSINVAELSVPFAQSLSCLASPQDALFGESYGLGSGIILVDREGNYSFAHRSFVDFYIAQAVFGGIADGDSRLLATAQTSHGTDQVIREFVEREQQSVRALVGWMRRGATPVLRVNSAGILAKLNHASVADTVTTTLKADVDTRQLYLTAVATRVLAVPWERAAHLAAGMEQGQVNGDYSTEAIYKLSTEISNPTDGAARWCSVVMLSHLRSRVPDAVTDALQRALRTETSRENLRTIGDVLAGNNPIGT